MKKTMVAIEAVTAFCVCPVASAASRSNGNSGNSLFYWFIGIMAAFLVLSVVIGIVSAVNADIKERDRNRQREIDRALQEVQREKEYRKRVYEKEQAQREREKTMSVQRRFIAQQSRLMSDSLRYDVMRRDGFRCQICGATQKDGVKLHVDHIFPVSKGGKTEMSNLRTLCERCNMGKRDKIENPETDYLDPYDDFDWGEPETSPRKNIGSVAIVDEYGREMLYPGVSGKKRKRK